MIITEQKPLKEILTVLSDYKKIFIVGCAQCATSCGTGGEQEVKKIKEILEEKKHIITGTTVIDPPCDERMVKIDFKKNKENIKESDIILILACGAGISVIAENSEKPICAGLNGIFLGSMKRLGIYNEYCSLCGNCVLSVTEGICPVTRCSKGLLNGPCGGTVNGKCEVNSEQDCAWYLIFEKSKKLNQLDKLKKYISAKDYSIYSRPNNFNKRNKIEIR